VSITILPASPVLYYTCLSVTVTFIEGLHACLTYLHYTKMLFTVLKNPVIGFYPESLDNPTHIFMQSLRLTLVSSDFHLHLQVTCSVQTLAQISSEAGTH
jgi:hypothetical protein